MGLDNFKKKIEQFKIRNNVVFFYDIDARSTYTKKVQPLKTWIGLSTRKRGDFMMDRS